MKIQCMLCKEIVRIGPFRCEPDGIHVTCCACAAEYFVSAAPDGATSEVPSRSASEFADVSPTVARKDNGVQPAGPDEMSCPKCFATQRRRAACGKCGLSADHFADFKESPGAQLSPRLEAAWNRVTQKWEDTARHEHFLSLVAEQGQFGPAAREYHRAKHRDASYAQLAEGYLERLARMAQAAVFTASIARAASSREEAPQPYKKVVIMLFLVIFVGGVIGMYAMLRTGGSATEQPPTMSR